MTSKVHVAVGVIKDKKGRFLISKRHSQLHQGGLWEFPGGKVEQRETVYNALCRELKEELDIQVRSAKQLVKISHRYPDKHVLLDVWLVDDYSGIPNSLQQQPLEWVLGSELYQYEFPKANKAILSCLSLSPYYAITGEFKNQDDFLAKIQHLLNSGIQLIQLRNKTLSPDKLKELANAIKPFCESVGAKLIINSDVSILCGCHVDGLHLTSKRLLLYSERPIRQDMILAASVHNQKQLLHAIKIGVDFVVISPVLKTNSHPDALPLDWTGLEDLAGISNIPIYALGGMNPSLLNEAKQTGAFGIAAINAFWN